MNAKLVATLTLVLGITASVVLGADKKAPPVAGTYKGAIEGEQAVAILKADGSIIVRPSADRPKFTMRGKWKRDGNTIIAKLKDPTGDEGTVVFTVDNGDLMLVKVISPDGEVEEHGAPQFSRNKRLADKGLAGVYVGKFDDEHLSVQVKPDGSFIVIPADDLNGGPIYVGKWNATKRGLRATVTSKDEEDEEESTVDFVTTATGLAIIKVVNGDGEVDMFDTRLKRQNQPEKKN
ncbi:MAG: hypothetical protein HOK62_06515 [Verrucomicrobiales bacterium]|nr:hypothetical protein [Verrucomicrobiales bacterium]MBT5846546.1 hypothetical protein [Verrucomicrobiales bacterium]MBT6450353.1 hypothetical protein [Verrucomicrobiales bacterium]